MKYFTSKQTKFAREHFFVNMNDLVVSVNAAAVVNIENELCLLSSTEGLSQSYAGYKRIILQGLQAGCVLNINPNHGVEVVIDQCNEVYQLRLHNDNVVFPKSMHIKRLWINFQMDVGELHVSELFLTNTSLHVNNSTHWRSLNICNCTGWNADELTGEQLTIDGTSLRNAPTLKFDHAILMPDCLMDLRNLHANSLNFPSGLKALRFVLLGRVRNFALGETSAACYLALKGKFEKMLSRMLIAVYVN